MYFAPIHADSHLALRSKTYVKKTNTSNLSLTTINLDHKLSNQVTLSTKM